MIQFNLLVSFNLNGGRAFPETGKTICVYMYLNKINKGKTVAYTYCQISNDVKKKKRKKIKKKRKRVKKHIILNEANNCSIYKAESDFAHRELGLK